MMYGESTSAVVERVAKAVVDAAFKVHTELGPGLLESVYVACLVYELRKRGFKVAPQVSVPIMYDGQQIESPLLLDVLVDDVVVVEVKLAEELHPVHKAQLATYLRLTNLELGLLINFNVALIKDGIKRVINPSRPSASRHQP